MNDVDRSSGIFKACRKMSTAILAPRKTSLEYPDSDGQPTSDNTVQFRWIQLLQGGLDAMFHHDPHVFVAGDLLWYPVEGDNDPEFHRLTVWIRKDDALQEVAEPDGWISPRLGVTFDGSRGELQVLRPDGRPFATYVELAEESERQREQAEQERQRAERLLAQLRALGAEPEA